MKINNNSNKTSDFGEAKWNKIKKYLIEYDVISTTSWRPAKSVGVRSRLAGMKISQSFSLSYRNNG